MIFNVNEIIELSGGKKHIIVDYTLYNDQYYYYVCEVNKEETNALPVFKVITTVNENGSLFVKTIKDDLEKMLINVFKSKNITE